MLLAGPRAGECSATSIRMHVKAACGRSVGQRRTSIPRRSHPCGAAEESAAADLQALKRLRDQRHVDVEVQKTDQELAGVIIGFKTDSVIGDPANYTLDVIDTLTSGFTYPTGYIFETLRGLGLVYVADARNVPGRDSSLPGTFEAYARAGVRKRTSTKVVDADPPRTSPASKARTKDVEHGLVQAGQGADGGC